jgi:hypothetical protein
MPLDSPTLGEDFWYFLYDEYMEQGGEWIAFKIDGSDDPPVIALSGSKHVELASRFSAFIYVHFWDWHTHYTFDYHFSISHHPGVRSLQVPAPYHIPVEHLRRNFAELTGTRAMRFYDEHCRILAEPYRMWQDGRFILHEDLITGGKFLADRPEALETLITRVWGNNAPVFHMKAPGLSKTTTIVDALQHNLLRRILRETGDWIRADRLAYLLGAPIPVLSSAMMNQVNRLIDQHEVEAHPDNRKHTQAGNHFRARP